MPTKALTTVELAAIRAEFEPVLGTEETHRSIDRCLNHPSFAKSRDKAQRMRSWLRDDAKRQQGGSTNGHKPPRPGERREVDPAEELARYAREDAEWGVTA